MTLDEALNVVHGLKPCMHGGQLCECGYFFSADGMAYALKVLNLNDEVDPVLERAGRLKLQQALLALADAPLIWGEQ